MDDESESDDPSIGNKEEIEREPSTKKPIEERMAAAGITNESSGEEKGERGKPGAGTMIPKMRSVMQDGGQDINNG